MTNRIRLWLWASLCALFCVGFVAAKTFAQVVDDPRPVVDAAKNPLEQATKAGIPTLFIVGDSTLKSNAPLRGWGSEIAPFFDLSKINVVNDAIGGRSSRTFQNEGRWDKVVAAFKPGDYVLVQFGHNDAGQYDAPSAKGRPALHGEGEETAEVTKADGSKETVHTFGWYMRKYGADAKAKGVTAIFCSMVPHKDWVDGKIKRGEKNTFVKWTADAAKATGASFIDLNEISARAMDAQGPEKVELLFGDARTHSTPAGAVLNATSVVSGLRALPGAPLDKYLGDKGRAVDPAPKDLVAGAQ